MAYRSYPVKELYRFLACLSSNDRHHLGWAIQISGPGGPLSLLHPVFLKACSFMVLSSPECAAGSIASYASTAER
jgi:hypothetical protein